MEQLNQEETGLKRNQPWHNRLGRFSLEEIALEFILWEDADGHDDAIRKEFIHQALKQSFGSKNFDHMLYRFLDTYQRLYEKIYQLNQGNRTKEERATPDSMRQLLNPLMMKKAA